MYACLKETYLCIGMYFVNNSCLDNDGEVYVHCLTKIRIFEGNTPWFFRHFTYTPQSDIINLCIFEGIARTFVCIILVRKNNDIRNLEVNVCIYRYVYYRQD